MRFIAILFAVAFSAFAQNDASTTDAKTVSLAWEDARNPAGVSYSVYRSNSTCSATSLFVKVATVPAKSYEDTGLAPGNYCYRVTAALNSLESTPSNSVDVTIPLHPPVALSATVK
ncbi:MAG: fibronectin type III domain-containing protein [Bryobacteraceae bacterium]